MQDKRIISWVLGLCLAGMCAAAEWRPPPSIHQRQARQFDGMAPAPLVGEAAFKDAPFASRSVPAVNRQVMGFYPYWSTGTANIQWDLLTILAYFCADATSTGSLSSLHGWPASAPIAEAHANGVKVLLTVCLFDADAIRTLVQSPAYRSALINNLFNQVSAAGADGVCVDFEQPYVADRAYVNTFIQELAGRFHADLPGSHVSIASPAVNWSDRYDFDTLTDHADSLFIMAYDYYYSGGPPGPNCPLRYASGSPWASWAGVEETVDDYLNGTYGVGEAKRHKLYLGLPYYGHDWPTTSYAIPGTSAGNASAVLYSSAAANAVTHGRHWDAWSSTPYYLYTSGSQPHQCWYDDGESLGLKWDLVNSLDLGGTGMWALNYDGSRPELWDGLRERFADPVPGTPGNPIPIEANPFQEERTTLGAPSRVLDAYSCAPATNESGPEVCYLLQTAASGDIFVQVSDGAGVDIDVHILDAPSAAGCLDRGHWSATVLNVPAGQYYIVADTWVDSGGVEYAGEYTLTVEFVPSDQWVETQLAAGVTWQRKSYPDLFGAAQFVNVVEVAAGSDVYVQPYYRTDGQCLALDELAAWPECLAAVNAGWWDGCVPSGLVRRFGQQFYAPPAGQPPRSSLGRNYFDRLWVRAVTAGADWPQAHFAVAAGPALVHLGAVHLTTAEEGFDPSLADAAGRAAAGVTPDGRLLLVTVDGTAGLGPGMALADLAQYLVWLGCEEAVLLGAGASTTMYVREAAFAGVANLPSGNGEPDHLGAAALGMVLAVTAITAPDSDGDALHDDVDPNLTVRHLDVDGDGFVDAADLAALAHHEAGNLGCGEAPYRYPECGDADLDGRTGATDLELLLAATVG